MAPAAVGRGGRRGGSEGGDATGRTAGKEFEEETVVTVDGGGSVENAAIRSLGSASGAWPSATGCDGSDDESSDSD